MAALYKLPCPSCDASISVTTTQAGEELTCHCGVQIQAPSMREIKLLPVVESTSPPVKTGSKWSAAQGALFAVGVLLIGAGIYGHLSLSRARNEIDTNRPVFEELSIDIQDITPFQAWKSWESVLGYTRGTGQLPPRRTPEFIARRKEHAKLSQYRIASWVVGGVGIVSSVLAFAIRPAVPSSRAV